jgi:flagellar hook-associated protein 2
MASITSTGIGTNGLDVEGIITKLMALEQKPLEQLQTAATTIQTKISAFGSVQSALASLRDAASGLTKSSAWSATTAMSSDATAVAVAAGSSAVAGSYNVSVQSLASSQSVASKAFATSQSLVGDGQLSIEIGAWNAGDAAADPPVDPGFAAKAAISAINIAISGTDSLADVRDKINASGAGVTASIVTDASGARLVLSSRQSGVENGFRITASGSADVVGFGYDPVNNTEGASLTQGAANARAKINGLEINSTSNTLTDVVGGMTMTLQKVTPDAGVQLSVSQDNAAIKATVQTFIDAFNNLAKMLKSQTKYDEGTKTAGTLQGDSTAVGLQRMMRNAVSSSSTASTAFASLSDAGLEVQADGTLKIDDKKFTAAQANLPELKKLFDTVGDDDDAITDDGFAARFRMLGDDQLGTDGMLSTRTAGLKSTLEKNQDRQDEMENRLANTEKRIRAQYQALDVKMAGLNSLSSYISQQVTNWNKSND